MGKRMKRVTGDESDSSNASSSDEMSPRRRYEARRHTGRKEGKLTKKILELMDEMRKQSRKLDESLHDAREMRKQLEKLTESHNDLCNKLELYTNGTRSQLLKQVAPPTPRYRLVFTSGDMGNTVEKGKNIEINVALIDIDNGQTVENGPLAYATVELVVVNAEFNQHDNQHNWSREDFERHIVTKQNSSTANVCQSVKSIVSNGRFNLVNGVKGHNSSTIFSNSSNKKVRLGVMVVSPMEERVLEGLSTSFFVRGHDRPNRQKQKGQLSNMQNSSSPDSSLAGGISANISGGNNGTVPPQPHSSQEQPASRQQHQVPDLQMFVPVPDSFWECLLDSDLVGPFGTQSNNYCSLPAIGFMSDYFGPMMIIPKEVKQTCGKRSVVIEPLEPDGSIEEVPLKRNLALFDYNTKSNFNSNITPTFFCEALDIVQEEKMRLDISESFLTKEYSFAGQPLGSWFHRSDEELTVKRTMDKNSRPKVAARCLASSRDSHLMASKPTGTGSTSPRPKGATQYLAPPPAMRYMATGPKLVGAMFPTKARPESSMASKLRHVSHSPFIRNRYLHSSIPLPPSLDSHQHLGLASTPNPNRVASGYSCVLYHLVSPPSCCFSSIFVNGLRSVHHDCFCPSSAPVSFVVDIAARPRILALDLSSTLPPMAMTKRHNQHDRGWSPAVAPDTRARDTVKSKTRKWQWSYILDWRFFVGFSLV